MAHLPRLIAASLLLGPLAAMAQALPAISYPTMRSAQLPLAPLNYMPAGNVRTLAFSNGELSVMDKYAGRVAANDVLVTQTRKIPALTVVRAVGSSAARLVPLVATVAALQAAYCALNASGWTCDPLTPPMVQMRWAHPNHPANLVIKGHESPEAASLAWVHWHAQQNGWVLGTVAPPICTAGGACEQHYQWQQPGYLQYPFNNSVQYINFVSTPTEVCLGGRVMVGDKCTTGDMRPATDAEIEARVVPAVTPSIVPIAEEALRQGVSIAPAPGPNPVSLAGPAQVVSPPVTSTLTSPTGQPQTRTETTTHNVAYNPVTNQYTWTNTTTINNYDGTTETRDERPEEDPRTECEKNPQSLACADTDTPDAPDIDTQTVNVSVAPDSGWGFDNASCPAASTVYVQGHAVQVDNTVYCGFFSGIRPVVIAVFSLAGAFIFLGGFKS